MVSAQARGQTRAWQVMRQLNMPLVIGGVIVGLLLGAAIAAPVVAPYDPGEAIVRFSGTALAPAPYPPGTEGMLLGSDALRRDLLSRLIYGSRYTLLVCGLAALTRMVIGTILGMLAGWYRSAGRVVDVLCSVSSAIPSLIFALIPLRLITNQGGLQASLIGFVLVLGLTGWAEAAIRCRVAVHGLRTAAFIDSAYAIGRGRFAVLWHHVRPNLRDLLVVETTYAMGAVLLLIAELSFLGIFIGGADIESIGGRVLSVDTIYAEWGSMLGRGLRERGTGAWLFLAPMAVFTLAIMGFNLLAEGLRRRCG